MTHPTPETNTPWQNVSAKFGLSLRGLARALGLPPSNLSRSIRQPGGLISSRDQLRVRLAARDHGIDIQLEDLVPTLPELPK